MSYVDSVIEQVKAKNANEPEFIQAVTEVLTSLKPVIDANPEYEKAGLLERIVEPERVICSVFLGLMIRARCRLTAASACSSIAVLDLTRAVFASIPL